MDNDVLKFIKSGKGLENIIKDSVVTRFSMYKNFIEKQTFTNPMGLLLEKRYTLEGYLFLESYKMLFLDIGLVKEYNKKDGVLSTVSFTDKIDMQQYMIDKGDDEDGALFMQNHVQQEFKNELAEQRYEYIKLIEDEPRLAI